MVPRFIRGNINYGSLGIPIARGAESQESAVVSVAVSGSWKSFA